MNKILILLLAIGIIPVATKAQTVMKGHTIFNGRVYIELPDDFKQNAAEQNNAAEWTDKNDSTILIYRLSADSITDNDIPAFIDDQIKLAKQDDKTLRFLDDGIFLQDGKNIGYLKYSAEETGTKFFVYLMFISVDNRLMTVSFMYEFEHRKRWEPIGDIIANSIRLKEKD